MKWSYDIKRWRNDAWKTWHKKFAWTPVHDGDGHVIWLERVWRRGDWHEPTKTWTWHFKAADRGVVINGKERPI